MKMAILKQGEHLIATLRPALTDDEMLALQESLVEAVGRLRVRGVLLDVSALDVLDSFGTRTLRTIAQVIRLRGATAVIVGVQPDVAFAMVQLGLTLEGVPTALDLESGLVVLRREIALHGSS
jgi:rsbT antagonist protein RsbS